LPTRRLRQALEVFGPVVGQGYGLTEAPMVASIAPPEYPGHPERLGSVGRIVPGMQARTDTGGQILVRGLALMEGYHGDPERTERVLRDGWLRTGDLGRFDEDGYLYLLGRADDVIVTGEHGTQVHPGVVEEALMAHPHVRQAAVVGRPGHHGTLLHAAVVAGAGVIAEELRGHTRDLLGQEHFVPATVEFTDALPLTAAGKVDRRAVAGE
jgi:acyl-CoA synthetase (AMP-forming)/AMP-acid ligase II